MTARLEVAGLCASRGGKPVLHDIALRLEAGRAVALLGPNGAGKSSLVLALAGLLPIDAGTISLDGRKLDGLPPHLIRRAGIAAVPEGHRVLTRLTVRENLEVAAAGNDAGDRAAAVAQAQATFPELAALADRPAGTLSGGQQQMLAFAQGLAARPTFLLADEMSLGLAPLVVRRLMQAVERIVAEGIGVLLIEQFTPVALGLADRAYVINRGRIRFEGRSADLRADPAVLHDAYLAAGA
jgi:branched-chain amino acid transport system ATP-binding protein